MFWAAMHRPDCRNWRCGDKLPIRQFRQTTGTLHRRLAMYFNGLVRLAMASVVLLVAGAAWADEDEEEVAVKDLPAKVVDAIEAKFPGAKITEAEKETEDGDTVYEVEINFGDEELEVEVSEDGKILEVEEEEDDDD